ncbi:MAG: flagellar hook-associated protein FlgL [Planctomycetes bacterium]|nr:flagellar hook-associated protein FlgL [Planctomycetota bacterium]
MTLRITQSMLFTRALQDIRNSSRGILRAQEQVATGRRLNRPSDDPSAMLRLLPLRAELQDFANLTENTHLADETLNAAASALEEASSVMTRLQELLVQASNGTISTSDRKSVGVEVDQLLRHMVGIANSSRGGSSLFGGTRTESAPFQLVEVDGRAHVAYRGASERHEIEVAPGVSTTLYAPGNQYFQRTDRSATTITGTTGAKSAGAHDTGSGYATLDVTFAQLDPTTLPSGITPGSGIANSTAVGPLSFAFTAAPASLSIGGGPPLAVPVLNGEFRTANGDTLYLDVATPVSPATGTLLGEADLSTDLGKTVTRVDFSTSPVAVRDSLDDSVLHVDVSTLQRTGSDVVTFHGTFDVFTALIAVRDTLQNPGNLSADESQLRLQSLIDEVSNAHDAILTGLQEVGIRGSNLELLRSRLDNLIASDTDNLSNIEDADLAETISEMTQKQFNFEASLQVSARIVQTSLLQFLR